MREHRIFAAVYDHINAPLERRVLGARRERLLGELTGEVLDVGGGTGVNLHHLRNAERVTVAEPDGAMRARLTSRLDRSHAPVEVSANSAEALPYADAGFDAVVCTLVLCTIPDADRALREMRRVLKPSGCLIVLEHVRGSGALARWQDRVDPLWTRLVAGCHLNRDTFAAIERSGFAWDSYENFTPLPRWVLTSAMLQGVASPA